MFMVECALFDDILGKGLNISNFAGIVRIIFSIAHYNPRHFTTKSFGENMNKYHGKFGKNQEILF